MGLCLLAEIGTNADTLEAAFNTVITSYSIHYTKLYDTVPVSVMLSTKVLPL